MTLGERTEKGREHQERMRFMNKVTPTKSKRYLHWLKRKNPNKEIHHILGSFTSLKMTDFLAVALSPEDHKRAEMHKAKFFIFYLPEAIDNLIRYTHHLERRIFND